MKAVILVRGGAELVYLCKLMVQYEKFDRNLFALNHLVLSIIASEG